MYWATIELAEGELMTSPMPALPRHIQFSNIAVLTDLGIDAAQSVRFAASFARHSGAKLTVAHACSPDFYVYVPPESLPVWPGNGTSTKERARQRTNSLIEKAGLLSTSVDAVISSASVPELLEDLELRQPDLLVLAPHARTGINKWLSGSVTAEVFRRSQWPVLVLPPVALNAQPVYSQFHKILFATDLSEVSAKAFAYAAGMALDSGGQMVALHVDEGLAYSFERVIALQRLEDWLHRQSLNSGISQWPECIVRFGPPAEEILRTATEYKTDLIVIGARGLGAMSGIASHFVGGTAYTLACSSPCPLLLIPSKRI
jgi:nucleotide-binding universal stress UspA family protein